MALEISTGVGVFSSFSERLEVTFARSSWNTPWKLTYPLKIDGWKMKFPIEIVLFRGHVSFRGCNIKNVEDFISNTTSIPKQKSDFKTRSFAKLQTDSIDVLWSWEVSFCETVPRFFAETQKTKKKKQPSEISQPLLKMCLETWGWLPIMKGILDTPQLQKVPWNRSDQSEPKVPKKVISRRLGIGLSWGSSLIKTQFLNDHWKQICTYVYTYIFVYIFV